MKATKTRNKKSNGREFCCFTSFWLLIIVKAYSPISPHTLAPHDATLSAFGWSNMPDCCLGFMTLPSIHVSTLFLYVIHWRSNRDSTGPSSWCWCTQFEALGHTKLTYSLTNLESPMVHMVLYEIVPNSFFHYSFWNVLFIFYSLIKTT